MNSCYTSNGFFPISTSSEGNAVGEMEEFTARTKEEAKSAAAVPLLRDATTGKSVKTRIVPQVCGFSHRAVTEASQNVLKLPKKNTPHTPSHTLKSLSLYICHTSAQSSQLQLLDCSYYHATRPEDYLQDAAALDRPQRRENREAWGRSEILLKKIVSLDTRNWRRLIHSDLNKTSTCVASSFSPLHCCQQRNLSQTTVK